MKLIIALIILIVLIGALCYAKKKLKELSLQLFGTESIQEGLEKQADEQALTPKSVCGMTRILEPQIEKDFPEFNWREFCARAENMLLSAFAAIQNQNAGLLREASGTVREQVENKIQSDRENGITEIYERARIHRTEIARYEKKNGTCMITLQSAVEYLHYSNKGGKVIKGDEKRLTQTRYNTELMYIQDAGKFGEADACGVNCANCGAPVTSLGAKHCEYCGAALTPVNVNVWSLERFYEV